MQFDKQTILGLIQDPSQRQQAEQQLPDVVDHEQHGALLQNLGINPQDLMSRFGQGGNFGLGGG